MADLQMASCEYHHVASGALTAYQQGFTAALDFYNDVVARVMIEEADRKVEWDVLTRVICLLLTLTNSEDGETASAATETAIQACWDDEVDVQHLDIDYLDPPDMLTLPELPPLPCTAEHEDHYRTSPPAECTALIALHNTASTSECSCLADEVADQTLSLGHYLMVDPAVAMTVAGGSWTINMDGQVIGGQLSAEHSGDFAALSAEMLTEDQTSQFENDGVTENPDYVGNIARIAWAYPSAAATTDPDTPMSLAQRFASRGGMVFLNAGGEVIEIRELASSSGPLGQPVSATLSFSSAEEITDDQAQAACPSMHAVAQGTRYYAQGARQYCWVMGGSLAQCANGCFVYSMVVAAPPLADGEVAATVINERKVVFPLIGGMHVSSTD